MEANFQRKVTIICEAYCFQIREFSNKNSFGAKSDFEFACEKSLCLINDFEHVVKFRSLLALLKHSQAVCEQQFAKFKVAAMILLCFHLTKGKLVYLHNSSIRLTWIHFKGFLYC